MKSGPIFFVNDAGMYQLRWNKYTFGSLAAAVAVTIAVNHAPVRMPLTKPKEAERIEQIEGIQKVVSDHLRGTDKFPAADKTNYFNATGFDDSLVNKYFIDLQKEKTALALTDDVINYNKSVRDNRNDKNRREWQTPLAGLGTFVLLLAGKSAYHRLRRKQNP
jgi:hypothetical protein